MLFISTLAFLILGGILYFNYPTYIEKRLEEAILANYPGTAGVQVELTSPVLSLLEGRIEQCTLEIANWQLATWTIDSFRGDFSGIRINLNYLLTRQTLVIEGVQAAFIQGMISEDNLNRGLKAYYSGIDVEILEDKLAMALKLEVMGSIVDGLVQGRIIAQDGQLVFSADDLQILGLNIPSYLERQILQRINIRIPLEDIPFPFKVTTVNIMQGKIFITGEI